MSGVWAVLRAPVANNGVDGLVARCPLDKYAVVCCEVKKAGYEIATCMAIDAQSTDRPVEAVLLRSIAVLS